MSIEQESAVVDEQADSPQGNFLRAIRRSNRSEYAGAFKGAIVGSVAAFLLSSFMYASQPAKASATLLLPSLGTIISQITTYYELMSSYVDQWAPGLMGLIEDEVLDHMDDEHREIFNAVRNANYDHAAYLATGEAPQVQAALELLGKVQNEDGTINPQRAAKYLLPPLLDRTGVISEEELNEIRDHAMILTQDQPIPQPQEGYRGTVAGTDYEYRRIGLSQQRLLAQDAITQYPMYGPKLAGYQDYLEQVQAVANGSMTPGQLLSSQVALMARVAIPAALDGLESDLRQERLMGAQVAALANRLYEEADRRLAEQGQ